MIFIDSNKLDLVHKDFLVVSLCFWELNEMNWALWLCFCESKHKTLKVQLMEHDAGMMWGVHCLVFIAGHTHRED